MINRRNVSFVTWTLIGVILDQATKWWIVHNLPAHRGQIDLIPGFLSIVHAQNPGAAFGMLGGFEYRWVLFLIFTLVAGVVIVDMFRKLPKTDLYMSTTLGLILSGAVGNAIDRVRQRYVTDFIRVYTDIPSIKGFLVENFGTNEWPSFNVADTALVIGVGLFVVHQLFLEEKPAEAQPEAAPAPAPTEPPLPPDDEPTEPVTPRADELPTDPGSNPQNAV